MSDLDKATDELAARAALAAGKEAAGRLAARLTSEDAAPERGSPSAAPRTSRRAKLIAIGLLALLVLVGLLGLVVSYWHWFLLIGLAGLLGLYGWHRLRKRLRSRGAPAGAAISEPRGAQQRRGERLEQPPSTAATVAPERPAPREQRSVDEELDEELAALKARVQK